MLPDDLEYRPKSDLIDLILQQQAQIEQLQAQAAVLQTQLAQLQSLARKNGSDLDAAAPTVTQPVPAGRFPLALKLMVLAAAAFACVIALIIVNFKPGATTSAGRAPDFPPGSVVAVQLPRPDRPDQSVPIFVVNDPVVGFVALHGRDPGSNCPMRWVPEVERIEDPCSGSKYTRTGEYLSGPSPRSLDKYPVTVGENGDITVDLSALQPGRPRP